MGLIHPFAIPADEDRSHPFVVVSAEGAEVIDNRGRRYLDGCAGLWCVNAGHGRREILDAMIGQAQQLAYFHSFDDFANTPAMELSEALLARAPPGMARVMFGCSGSDANDTNVKLVWRYHNLTGRPEKKKIIALDRAYHGVTVTAASLSGLSGLHADFDVPSERFRHVSTPMTSRALKAGEDEDAYAARMASEVDRVIRAEGPQTVAAFFVEPVLGAGGVLAPPRGYLERVAAVLREHDVLLVVDEVVCGFGRLGAWFGSNLYGLTPDLMTLGKGLTSGYQPLSASILSERVWDVLRGGRAGESPLPHGFTFSAHPIATAAALANVQVLEKDGLIAAGRRMGAELADAAREALERHPLVEEVRSAGAMLAIELISPEERKDAAPLPRQVRARAREHGLLLRTLSDGCSVVLCPPLIFTASQVRTAIEILRRTFDDVLSGLITPPGDAH